MAAIFLVDRTWQPILDTCINSVSMVFSDYIQLGDRFGMYSLGDGWIIPLARKSTIHSNDIQSAKVCVGTCVLYKSMIDCLKVLSAVKGSSRWLVVLTDTVDLEERFDSEEAVVGDTVVVVDSSNADCSRGKLLSTGPGDWQVDLGQQEIVQAPKEWVQTLWEPSDDATSELDPELKRRLLAAGARVGDVTLSLMWDNIESQNDLDIHVRCELPRGTSTLSETNETISFSLKKVSGGLLDVDARETVKEPVENVFWDMAEAGTFTCTVHNYMGWPRKEWLVCLRSKVPITLLNEDGSVLEEGWTGARQVRGVCTKVGDQPFAFKFRVVSSRQLKDVSSRPQEVKDQIVSIADLNLVVIDSSKISGWEPTSYMKWARLKSNISDFVAAAGECGHLIKADNEDAVRAAFESVAAMMAATGISEDL